MEGKLFGWLEAGFEGTQFALQRDGVFGYEGIVVIQPGYNLAIFKNGEEIFNGVIEGVYSHEEHKLESEILPNRLKINEMPVSWIPTNIDLDLWFKIFFEPKDDIYTGKITKRKKIY